MVIPPLIENPDTKKKQPKWSGVWILDALRHFKNGINLMYMYIMIEYVLPIIIVLYIIYILLVYVYTPPSCFRLASNSKSEAPNNLIKGLQYGPQISNLIRNKTAGKDNSTGGYFPFQHEPKGGACCTKKEVENFSWFPSDLYCFTPAGNAIANLSWAKIT